jgi:hypothetical protein
VETSKLFLNELGEERLGKVRLALLDNAFVERAAQSALPGWNSSDVAKILQQFVQEQYDLSRRFSHFSEAAALRMSLTHLSNAAAILANAIVD